MKKVLILFLLFFIVACGGSSEESSVEDTTTTTAQDTTTTTVQDTTTTTIPPAPTVDFNIVEIYNTKLVSELCSDANEIDTTSEECLRQYRDNLETVFSYAENLQTYVTELNNYLEAYPSAMTEEYTTLFQFVNDEYQAVPETYGNVANKYIERFGGAPVITKLENTENLWNECSANSKIFGTENLKNGILVFKNTGGEKITISLNGPNTIFNDKLNVSGGSFVLTDAKLFNYLGEEYSFNDENLKLDINTWDAVFNKIEILDFNKDSLTLEILWSDGILKMEVMNFYFKRYGLYSESLSFNVVTPYGKTLPEYDSNTSMKTDKGVEYIENTQGKTVVRYNFFINDGVQLNSTPMYLLRMMTQKIDLSGHELTYYFRLNNDYSKISHYEFWRKVGCSGESSVYEAYDVIYDIKPDLTFAPFNLENLKIFIDN